MNKEKINITDRKIKSAYRVPDGYFSDLHHKIMLSTADQIQNEEFETGSTRGGGWRRYFRLAGFAVSFAVMVVSFSWGFKVITERFDHNQSNNSYSTGYDLMLLSMYDITSNDIILTSEDQNSNIWEHPEDMTDYDNYVIDEANYDLIMESILIETN